MSWAARLRLALGLVVVVAAVAGLTLHLNAARGEATSASASIRTQTYAVGTPYAGMVVEQEAEVGQEVSTGDTLFVVESATLRRDLLIGLVDADLVATGVSDDGRLTITATADGVLSDVAVTQGSFVQSGAQLAVVDTAGTLTVEAELELAPEEFARLEDGAPVALVLPDGTGLAGAVERVEAVTTGGRAHAVVTVTSDELERGAAGGLVAPGTPVTATVALRNEGVVSTVAEQVSERVDGLLSSWGW